MTHRAIGVVLLLSTLLIAGCGTVANVARPGPEGGKIPFGGVAHDMSYLQSAANGEGNLGTHSEPTATEPPKKGLMVLCAADLPFSFICDVVTWPYTAAYTYINQPIPAPMVTPAHAPTAIQGRSEPQPPAPMLETLPEPRKEP